MRRFLLNIGSIFFVIIIFCFLRNNIFSWMGEFLLVDDSPHQAEVIVPLRGDRTYTRVIEAAHLFEKGFAPKVLVSTALEDDYAKRLQKWGINITTQQDNLFNILVGAGVPPQAIILDRQSPGGGTEGELKRIKYILQKRRFHSIIVVTNWYHTRRVKLMSRRIFSPQRITFFVVSAKRDISGPSNWWHYRYEAIKVLEEFVKLGCFYIEPIFNFSFADDPKKR